MQRLIACTPAALLLAIPIASHAAPGMDVNDIDGDERISREEARRDRMLETHFIAWDTDRDGFLDESELHSGLQARNDTAARNLRDAASVEAVAFAEPPGHEPVQGTRLGASLDRHDADGDGRISREEAATDPRLAAEFETLDMNNDGLLQEHEVVYDPAQRPVEGGNFRAIDVNRDGYLARSEAANDEYVDSNFTRWDVNDDGVLDRTEVDRDWAEWDRDAFGRMDRNADGMIGRDEASQSAYLESRFEDWDADGDDLISQDEANAGWTSNEQTHFNDEAW